jgi:NodT family efflux transporter outer membrane factor (OMF) lipoprotein
MMRAAAGGLCLALGLAACSFAPPYKVPGTPPPAEKFQESQDWKVADPQDTASRGDWWSIFNDAQLDELERAASDANQNLKAAFARLQQARADTRIARADLFPQLTGQASVTRARTSPNSPRSLPGYPTTGTDFNLEADVSYEVDLWGRVRNEVASAKATQQASAADLASMQLSVEAELASDYFTLRSRDRQQLLLDQTVADYETAWQLQQRLFDGGAVPLSDLAQARAQLETARTQDADNKLARDQTEHAIAVLIGLNPSSYHLPPNPLPDANSVPAIDPGLPSSLLERRPDIAEAERRVASANAQIGVARAAYFPQFNLAGSAGYNSVHSYNWLSAPSRFWSIGPEVTLPIFEGGRLMAQTERAKAAYEEQVATYRNTVLAAYQDVEDNLAAQRHLTQEDQTQAAAVDATRTASQQAQHRYNAGAVTYLEVSVAETALLQAQLTAVDIQLRRLNASVLLVKSLGGGWKTADLAAAEQGVPASSDTH